METTDELTEYEQFENDSNKLQTKEGFTDWITGLRDAKNQSNDSSQPAYKEVAIAIPWNEFRAQKFEEPRWIVDKLIPEKGLAAISGSPESGKSYFATFLAITIAQGKTLFDQYQTTRTGVLIIDQENLPTWIQKRINQFSRLEELPLYIYQAQEKPLNIEDKTALGQIDSYVEQNSIGLVIVDTLRLIHNRDENSSAEMKPVFDGLKNLTKKTAVLLIHHNRKTDRFNRGKMDGEDMMGSIFIRGCLDSQLSLSKVSDISDSVTKIRVSQTKARYTKAIMPFDITLEETDDGLTFIYQGVVETDSLKKDDAKGIILLLLEDQTFKRQELIDHLVKDGICGQRTAESALAELLDSGKITHSNSKPHIYSLPNPSIEKIPQTANTYIDYGIAESQEQK